jgi:DNA-binding SARP family transcriptional activator
MVHGHSATARLLLLGQFQLLARDGTDISPRGAKSRALLAFLALAPSGSADRGRLADLLWSEGSDAKASLRQCLRELRHAVDAHEPELVDADTHNVWLALGRLSVDALELRRYQRPTTPADVAALGRLWAGDLLADLAVDEPEFDQWLVTERAAFRDAVCRGLEQALTTAQAVADTDRAGGAAEVILRIDPAHEAAHRALMARHGRRGDLAAAIHQYEVCRGALRLQLDTTPSPETETLLRDIRQGRLRREADPVLYVPRLAASRQRARVSIAIEQQNPASGDTLDRSVIGAIAAALRESLTRKSWLAVVDSPMRSAPAVRQALEAEGGPRYVVRLHLFRLDRRVRLSAELRDAASGEFLWVHHYDRKLGTDVFGLVDELATALARWLDREVEVAEIDRATRHVGPPQSPYDNVMRAIPLIFELTPDSFVEARRLLSAAQEATPNDPMVYAWLAFWSFLNIGQGWSTDPVVDRQELDFVVRRALELDRRNPMALAVAGHIASFIEHDYDKALRLFDRSLDLDPTSAYTLDLSALTLCYTGRPTEGLRRLQATRDVWERHPNASFFRTTACIGLMLAGRYEQAVELCQRTIRENPSFHAPYRPLIASLGQLGRLDEAHRGLIELQRLEPGFSIGWFRDNYPPLQQDVAERYIDGLRKAGVPAD